MEEEQTQEMMCPVCLVNTTESECANCKVKTVLFSINWLKQHLLSSRGEYDRMNAKLLRLDSCMCGSPMTAPYAHEGHTPTSMIDTFLDQEAVPPRGPARVRFILAEVGIAYDQFRKGDRSNILKRLNSLPRHTAYAVLSQLSELGELPISAYFRSKA